MYTVIFFEPEGVQYAGKDDEGLGTKKTLGRGLQPLLQYYLLVNCTSLCDNRRKEKGALRYTPL